MHIILHTEPTDAPDAIVDAVLDAVYHAQAVSIRENSKHVFSISQIEGEQGGALTCTTLNMFGTTVRGVPLTNVRELVTNAVELFREEAPF